MKYCYSFYCEVRTTAPKCSIIRDQVVPERLYLSDNRHATVVIPPAHRPFALSRKPFRPWSKALSTQVKSPFDTGQKPFRLRAKSKGVVVIAVNSCVFVY